MALTRLDINQAAVNNLAHDAAVRAELKRDGDEVAARARSLAPKLTGAGARSIHAEVEGDEVHVGWDEDHAYMLYPEYGTRSQRAQPFLRPAVMTPLRSNVKTE